METQSALLAAALENAIRGWKVFPLHTPTDGNCSCGAQNCQKVGKHPRTRHGLKEATTDEDRIRAWWHKWPDANIGVATGTSSGLVVLDVDDKEEDAGSQSLAALEEQHGALPATLVCITGAGRHFYFSNSGHVIKSSVGKIGAGLDVRGDGGYVVAPPSMHANGRAYAWNNSSVAPAELPGWLFRLASDEAAPVSNRIRVGSRNNELTRIAGGLRAQGMGQQDIETQLQKVNDNELEEPLSKVEVRGIAASIARYPCGSNRLDLPWFMFYPKDWFSTRVVRIGKDFQRGWYIHLLTECWFHEGTLPNDPELLWQLAGAASRQAFEHDGNNLLVLDEFEPVQFEEGACILVHHGMAKHYREQAEKYLQKCEASKKSAAKRRKTPADNVTDGWQSDEVQVSDLVDVEVNMTQPTNERSPKQKQRQKQKQRIAKEGTGFPSQCNHFFGGNAINESVGRRFLLGWP